MISQLKSLLQRKTSIAKTAVFASFFGFVTSVYAQSGPNIGSGGGTGFSIIKRWLQNWVDFMSGPFAIAAIITSVIIAYVAWAFLPKEGLIGPTVRVVVAGIVVLNVGVWVSTLAGF